MSIYISHYPERLNSFTIRLRKMGFTAYTEQDGANTLLITNYNVTGVGFTYTGRR